MYFVFERKGVDLIITDHLYIKYNQLAIIHQILKYVINIKTRIVWHMKIDNYDYDSDSAKTTYLRLAYTLWYGSFNNNNTLVD